MRYVKITRGAYGHRTAEQSKDKNGETIVVRTTTTKTPKDPPFPLPDEEATRLVKMGVAAYSEEPKSGVAPDPGVTEKPAYNTEMSAIELRALLVSAQPGIKLSASTSKTTMVEMLDEIYAAKSEGEPKVDEDTSSPDGSPDGDSGCSEDGDENGESDGDDDGEYENGSYGDDNDGGEEPPDLGAEAPVL